MPLKQTQLNALTTTTHTPHLISFSCTRVIAEPAADKTNNFPSRNPPNQNDGINTKVRTRRMIIRILPLYNLADDFGNAAFRRIGRIYAAYWRSSVRFLNELSSWILWSGDFYSRVSTLVTLGWWCSPRKKLQSSRTLFHTPCCGSRTVG